MKRNLIMTTLLFGLAICLTSCGKCRETKNPKCGDAPPTDEACQAAFLSWFYNKDKNECEQIGYSGCSASGFATEEECEECQCK